MDKIIYEPDSEAEFDRTFIVNENIYNIDSNRSISFLSPSDIFLSPFPPRRDIFQPFFRRLATKTSSKPRGKINRHRSIAFSPIKLPLRATRHLSRVEKNVYGYRWRCSTSDTTAFENTGPQVRGGEKFEMTKGTRFIIIIIIILTLLHIKVYFLSFSRRLWRFLN